MLDFPNSPITNDTFSASNGVVYTFDGTKWVVSGSGTGPYLLTAGGTMTGSIVLAADPTTDPQAANKHYVDASINLAGNYLGTWSVASNTPNISAGGSISNANYVATTVNPATPETVPVGVPGIAGMTVANGDRIIWASGLGTWQILRNAGVTLAAADARYVALGGSTMTGPLIMAGDARAVTPTYGDNDTSIATTAFVQAAAAPYANNTGRNRLHNAGFSVNQRSYASGGALAAGAYAHDRWKAGSGGGTYTFTQTQPLTTVTITAGSLQQVVEAMSVEGGTYTLSWTGTAQGRVNAGAYGASPVTVAGLAVNTAITVEFNTGTLGSVQLEPGSIATPLAKRDPAYELALCQRFYQTGIAYYLSYGSASMLYQASVPLVTPMRATPTTTQSPVIATNCSAFAVNAANNQAVVFNATVTALGSFQAQTAFTASADL